MADQDELRLRIVPELDQQAKKQVEDELSTISGNIPIGGKPSTGGSESALRKSRLADIRAEIDLIDLRARKKTVEAQKEIKDIQQRMSLNRLSLQEGARLIAEQENLRERAADEAIEDIQLQIQLTDKLNLTKGETANLERKAFFASERMRNGFTTMSGSMTQLTTNTAMLTSRTKEANIAFANFGRIVQDAPFGILGISNNIDPLLVSFAALKASTGSTTLALRSMLGVMMGPLGLIFLLGSVLPSALVVAERHFQRKKKATREAKEEVDEFAEALKRAAGTQVSDLLPATMTTEEKIQALSSALKQQNALMHNQSVLVSRQLADAKEQFAALVENGRLTQEQADIELKRYKQWLGITADQDMAVAESLSMALKQQEANKLVEDSIANINIERKKTTDELKKEFELNNSLLSLQLTFNDAIRESRDAYLAQALAIRIASQVEAKAFEDKVKREAGKGRDTTLTDDSDFERGLKQREVLERIRIESLRRMGQEEQAITLETEIAKRDAVLNLLKLGITDQETIDQELANIEQEGANRTKDNELTVADSRAEAMRIYSNAVAQGLGAIFGENKAVQSAQVVIDTIAGAQKAFAGLMPNIPVALAASGAVVAQGISALRKINSTEKGAKSVSKGSSPSVSAPSAPSFVNDLGAAGMVAGTIGPFGASMTPNISITANLDRQGLALAVRDGESDIATRQIPFAS